MSTEAVEKTFPPFSIVVDPSDYSALRQVCAENLEHLSLSPSSIGRVAGLLRHASYANKFGFSSDPDHHKGVTFSEPSQIESKIFDLPKIYAAGPVVGGAVLELAQQLTTPPEVGFIAASLDEFQRSSHSSSVDQ